MSRHVVVTGASSGIGAACARAFAKLGDRLSLGARRTERLTGVVPGAFCHSLDVTKSSSVERFVDAAIAANGPIDVLVNNAGLARGVEKIAEGTGEAWREMIETNVLGTATLLDTLRTIGREVVVIVVTSDKCYENRGWVYSYRENDRLGGRDVYSMSKAAAELVTASYRQTFFGGESGIRVASVRAGNVIGGGDRSANRIVPDCVSALVKGEPVRVRNPSHVRPWQHVLEPLSGYLLLASRLLAGEWSI